MAEQHAIQVFARSGWSQRRIGRELWNHRETVAAYIRCTAEAGRAAESTPAISILCAEAADPDPV